MSRLRPAKGGHRPVVAVSGPDGAGKTSLVRKLRDGLADEGLAVRLGYCYGCVVCRRLDRPSGVAGAAFALHSTARGAAVGRPPMSAAATWRERFSRLLRTLHGHVDAYELALRLRLLRLMALVGPPAVVVTDRGPLDGLAKHDPRPGSLLTRRYLRLASRYDLTVLLDAPAEVLAQRDGEHGLDELDSWRRLYRRWADVAAAAGNEVVAADTVARTCESIADDLCHTLTSAQTPIAMSGARRRT